MDFALDDAQRAIAALAADVLARNGSAHHDHGEFSSDGAENSPRSWNDTWCNLASAGLNHERVMLGPAGRLGALLDRVLRWAVSHDGPDGRPLACHPDVRRAIAQVGRHAGE